MDGTIVKVIVGFGIILILVGGIGAARKLQKDVGGAMMGFLSVILIGFVISGGALIMGSMTTSVAKKQAPKLESQLNGGNLLPTQTTVK
jgi:NAD/NADP transhydrogenase alpha subunit